MRPTRSRTAALAALTATLAAPGAAIAGAPVFTIPSEFTSADSHGVNVGGEMRSMSAPAGTPGGGWGIIGWCTPYEATEVVGFNYVAARWHEGLGNGVQLQEEDTNGVVRYVDDSTVPRGVIAGFGPGTGRYTMSPSRCIAVKTVVRSRLTTAAAWTIDLASVELRDLQGPAVSAVEVPGGWLTGDRMPFAVVTSDNAFNRGLVTTSVNGGAETHGTDPANGRITADTDVSSLPDGAHTFTVIRRANGWADATGSVTFRVDRNAPGTPSLSVATGDWISATGVWVESPATGDGNGSGWHRNQFSVDGGPWTDGPNAFSFGAEGQHSVRVRAVDVAGHVSPPSDPQTTRIDRTPPDVDVPAVSVTSGYARFRVAARDRGGSGLGRGLVEVRNADGSPVVSLLSGSAASLQDGHDFSVPLTRFAAGSYTVVVHVFDGAGNDTRRTSSFSWTPPAPPATPATPARTSASPSSPDSGGGGGAPGAPAGVVPSAAGSGSAAGGGAAGTPGTVTAATGKAGTAPRRASATPVHWWRPVVVRGRVGSRAALRGRLMTGRTPVPAGTRLRVRDSAGVIVASGRVRQDGSVVMRIPVRSREAVTVLRVTGGAGARVQVRPVAR